MGLAGLSLARGSINGLTIGPGARLLKQDEAKPLLSQLRRDDEGTAETKNCEKPVLDSGGSPDTLTSSDALTTASFSAEEAEEISGVGADEAQEVTTKWTRTWLTSQDLTFDFALLDIYIYIFKVALVRLQE